MTVNQFVKKLLERTARQTSWGRNQLKDLILEIITEDETNE